MLDMVKSDWLLLGRFMGGVPAAIQDNRESYLDGPSQRLLARVDVRAIRD